MVNLVCLYTDSPEALGAHDLIPCDHTIDEAAKHLDDASIHDGILLPDVVGT